MSNNALISSLYRMGCIQFGSYQLKSGENTSVYVNLRKIISHPDILRQIAAAMWEVMRSCKFDLICGVPYAALPVAVCLSLEHNIPLIMRRKERKDYGTKQLIEGEFKPGQRCLIIEDVVTTGVSIIETAVDLEKAGLIVTDVVALIDRGQGGKENLAKKYQPHTLFSLPQILQSLLAAKLLSNDEQQLASQFLG